MALRQRNKAVAQRATISQSSQPNLTCHPDSMTMLHCTKYLGNLVVAAPAMNAPVLDLALQYPWSAAPAPGAAHEVAPGIGWLRMPLPFALDHINLWLLADTGGWAQVDCGFGDAATRRLWEGHFAT